MPTARPRTPDEPLARRIARRLYPDLQSIEWIPSDDADVFRLRFGSTRGPRILKLAGPAPGVVEREVAAFPAMRALGISEVLELEHSSADLPNAGTAFHVTPELLDPPRTNRELAELWAGDRSRALELAERLGDCARRVEALDWRSVPLASTPERAVETAAEWWLPEYARLAERPDRPDWAASVLERLRAVASRPPDAFGGWGGELLRAPGGGFVPIDWPGLGAAHGGSFAAAMLETLRRFRAEDPAPLVQRFVAGWRPGGLDDDALDELRLWSTHDALWWAGWRLGRPDEPAPDLARVYARVRLYAETDDPAAWLDGIGYP